MSIQKPTLVVVPPSGDGIPEAQILQLEEILRAAKAGEVSGFVFVAVGADFNTWREGYVKGKGDRMNLLGQLRMAERAIEDSELES